MLLLRSIFFFILLFHCSVFSQAQERTAGEVFFDFVDQYTQDIEDVMEPTWFDDIFEDTESWTFSDARRFLNLLAESEYPTSHVLIVLRNTQSLQRIQKQVTNSQFQTGSDVFIDYVRSYFTQRIQANQPQLEGEAFEDALESLMLTQMSSRRNAPLWDNRIRKDAQYWSRLDAILFLDALENEWDMDIDVIIKRLNSTSFFQIATYTPFTLRLAVYIEHFGKSHVKKILDNTFFPFKQSNARDIEALLVAVFTYFNFEKAIMIEILTNNLQVISLSTLGLFNRRTAWLEDFFGRGDRDGKAELNWVIQNKSFQGVVNFKIYKNKYGDPENEYVQFLRERGLKPVQIADLFKSYPQAFSMGDLAPDKITYLEQLLGVEEEVEIQGQMTVKRRDGKAELDWVIQNKSFRGIVNFKIYKNKQGQPKNERVEFLKQRGLEPVQIADLFKSNPLAFSAGDLATKKITYLEQLLEVEELVEVEGKRKIERRDGKAELDWMIQNKSFQGIVNFKIYKNEQEQLENEYVHFLKKRGLEPVQIADVFKRNPLAFSRGDLATDKITYLEALLEVEELAEVEGQMTVKRRDGKTELDWVIQNKSFQGIVNFRIYKNQQGDFKNNHVEFLKQRDLTPVQIADIFKSNPLAFSKGDLSTDKIAYLERYLGKGDRNKGKEKLNRIILKKGGFQALALFEYNNNTQSVNREIDFLENGMHFNQDQVIEIMEDHFSELFVEDLTEETLREYIEKLMKKVPDICKESLS